MGDGETSSECESDAFNDPEMSPEIAAAYEEFLSAQGGSG